MGKIASFEDFKKKASQLSEDDLESPQGMDGVHGAEEAHGREHQYYMFFKNLSAIKHYIEEIEKMDPDQLDQHLRNGHDWAADHIATSKDDIQEVADWVRSEMEGGSGEPSSPEQPENIIVDVEGDDDNVEVETGEEGEEKEEEEEDTEDEDEE